MMGPVSAADRNLAKIGSMAGSLRRRGRGGVPCRRAAAALHAGAAALRGGGGARRRADLRLPYGRELGQVVVGLAIGLRFTPAVALATTKLLPVMLVSTGLIILATGRGGADPDGSPASTGAPPSSPRRRPASSRWRSSPCRRAPTAIRSRCSPDPGDAIVATVPFLVTLFGERRHPVRLRWPFGAEALPLAGLFWRRCTCSAFRLGG